MTPTYFAAFDPVSNCENYFLTNYHVYESGGYSYFN